MTELLLGGETNLIEFIEERIRGRPVVHESPLPLGLYSHATHYNTSLGIVDVVGYWNIK